VSDALLECTLAASRQFFALPNPSGSDQDQPGASRFVPTGQTVLGTGLKADLKESFNFSTELAADDPDLLAGKPLMGRTSGPTCPAGRRPCRPITTPSSRPATTCCAASRWRSSCPRIISPRCTSAISGAAAAALPPQTGPISGDELGASRHSDYGCITLLSQDPLGGLEIENRAATGSRRRSCPAPSWSISAI